MFELMKAGDKYKVPNNEQEGKVLPNKLGITDEKELEKEEAKGFVQAQIEARIALNKDTVFNLDYVMNLHKTALDHIYDFAGRERTVNMSKAGFVFPSALHLTNSLKAFENDLLSKLKHKYDSKQELINDIADVHAELLFIHPFRDGNGRTARILSNLMAEKAGYDRLLFEKLDNTEMFERYVKAIQAASGTYKPMRELIALLFQP